MGDMRFHVGVKALITNDEGKFLVVESDNKNFIVKSDPSHGDLVGGRIESNQQPEEALRREIEEETGITDVSIGALLTAVTSPMRIPASLATPDDRVGLLLMIYRVIIPANAEIVLSDEHSKFEWLDRETAASSLEYKFGTQFSDWLQSGAAEVVPQ